MIDPISSNSYRVRNRLGLTNSEHGASETVRRAETAQRLQSCDRLRSRGVAADADSDTDLSVPRDSKLGNPVGLHRRTDQCMTSPREAYRTTAPPPARFDASANSLSVL